jgi:hypothetical protein
MGESNSLVGRVVTWAIIGLIAILAAKIAFAVLGIVLGFAGFVLFTVAPILLIGWLAAKAWRAFSRPAA